MDAGPNRRQFPLSRRRACARAPGAGQVRRRVREHGFTLKTRVAHRFPSLEPANAHAISSNSGERLSRSSEKVGKWRTACPPRRLVITHADSGGQPIVAISGVTPSSDATPSGAGRRGGRRSSHRVAIACQPSQGSRTEGVHRSAVGVRVRPPKSAAWAAEPGRHSGSSRKRPRRWSRDRLRAPRSPSGLRRSGRAPAVRTAQRVEDRVVGPHRGAPSRLVSRSLRRSA